MRRGRFELPESVKLTLQQYRRTVDTVQAFLAEGWHLDPDGWVDRAELYRSYRAWCQDGGRLPLANVGFNAHLTQTYGDSIAPRKRAGRPGWVGLAAGGDEGDVGDVLATLTYSLQSSRARASQGESVIRKGGEGIPDVPGVPGATPSGTTAALPLGTNGRDPAAAGGDNDEPALSAKGVDAAYRLAQLARGERPAYPEVELRPGVVLPAGRLSWERFLKRATPAQVGALAQRLDKLEASRGGEEVEL